MFVAREIYGRLAGLPYDPISSEARELCIKRAEEAKEAFTSGVHRLEGFDAAAVPLIDYIIGRIQSGEPVLITDWIWTLLGDTGVFTAMVRAAKRETCPEDIFLDSGGAFGMFHMTSSEQGGKIRNVIRLPERQTDALKEWYRSSRQAAVDRHLSACRMGAPSLSIDSQWPFVSNGSGRSRLSAIEGEEVLSYDQRQTFEAATMACSLSGKNA